MRKIALIRYWSLRNILLMLLDILCVHMAFAAMVLLMKYLIGDDFGAVVTVKNYLRIWLGFSAAVFALHTLSGEYRERRKSMDWVDAFRLLLVVLIEFAMYYWSRKTWLDLPVRLYFVCLHGGSTYLGMFLLRLFFQEFQRVRPQLTASRHLLAKRTLIVGAGRAGQNYAAILQVDPENRGFPVAFVDDDPLLRNRKFQGLRVVGDRDAIPEVARTYNVERIVIAIPFPPQGALREILERCRQTSCEILKMDYGEPELPEDWRKRNEELPPPEDLQLWEASLGSAAKLQSSVSQSDSAILDELLCLEERGGEIHTGCQRPHQRLYLSPLSLQERLDRPTLPDYRSRLRACIRSNRILLLGAGRMGTSLAEQILLEEPESLLLVDPSQYLLQQSQNRLLRQLDFSDVSRCQLQLWENGKKMTEFLRNQGPFDHTWVVWDPGAFAGQEAVEEAWQSLLPLLEEGSLGSVVVLESEVSPLVARPLRTLGSAWEPLFDFRCDASVTRVRLGSVLDNRDPALLEWIADAVSLIHEGHTGSLHWETFPFPDAKRGADLMIGEAVFWALVAADLAPTPNPYYVHWGEPIALADWLQLLALKYGFICPDNLPEIERPLADQAIDLRPTPYPGLFEAMEREDV